MRANSGEPTEGPTSGAAGQPALPSWAVVASVVSLAACYAYFLLFTEFALVEIVRARTGGASQMRGVLALLALGGILGSALGGSTFGRRGFRVRIVGGFLGCAATAALAVAVKAVPLLMAVVGASGVSLGWLTVTLVTGLAGILPLSRVGVCAGAGTGLAYAFCNLPQVFSAEPRIQAWMSAGAAAVGAAASIWARSEWSPSHTRQQVHRRETHRRETRWRDNRRQETAAGIVVFMALVWLDSGAFYAIQHTDRLRLETWTGSAVLAFNACVHLIAAVVAGVLVDRGRMVSVLAVAVCLLSLACEALHLGIPGARWFYVAGVSLYSVALIAYPIARGRPWVSAGLFIVSGWIGSALGIGMVQDLSEVPGWFLIAATASVGAGLAVWRRAVRRAGLRGPGLALAVITAAGCLASPVRASDRSQILLGRGVYIAEGCIQCHSQYVRATVPTDVLWWGPARTLSQVEGERPPLIGNRRQGPDLSAVGARRTHDWEQVHLLFPRLVSSDSRMPGYAYLFGREDPRGPALVAYLDSLGGDEAAAHFAATRGWRPVARGEIAMARARQGFVALCAGCHGSEGRGDGALASKLAVPPADLTAAKWRHVEATDRDQVARIIKFGLPGVGMAGREYLSDEWTIALAAYAASLRRAQ